MYNGISTEYYYIALLLSRDCWVIFLAEPTSQKLAFVQGLSEGKTMVTRRRVELLIAA